MAGQDSSDWLGLSGRVCVVTGGGGGIGRATASSFAEAGAKVAAIDRDERGLEVDPGRTSPSWAVTISWPRVTLRAPRASPPHPRRSRKRWGRATCL